MTNKPKFKVGDTVYAYIPEFKLAGKKPIMTKILFERFKFLEDFFYPTDTGAWNENALYATEEEAYETHY